MCSSNWKVESNGRSTKGSGGIEDTNLQNKRKRKPSVILSGRRTKGKNLLGIWYMPLGVTL